MRILRDCWIRAVYNLGSRFTCKVPVGQAIGRPGDLHRLRLEFMVSEKNLMTRGPRPVKKDLRTITLQPLHANHPYLGTDVSQASCILLRRPRWLQGVRLL